MVQVSVAHLNALLDDLLQGRVTAGRSAAFHDEQAAESEDKLERP